MEYQDFTVDTTDREDHTFSGIFFDVTANERLPLKYVEIYSLSVRGDLGPLTVWFTPDGHTRRVNSDIGGLDLSKLHDETEWTKVYERAHDPSFEEFVELKLDVPIRVESGKRVGFYIHSKLPGDTAIVYDDMGNAWDDAAAGDGKLIIWPGTAHLSCRPFGRRAPWGGDALRRYRLFVGRVSYGCRWMLWNPEVHARFPPGLRKAVRTMLLCGRRPDCHLYHLGDEILFYILNKCGWDWFGSKMPSALGGLDFPGHYRYDEKLLVHVHHVIREVLGFDEDELGHFLRVRANFDLIDALMHRYGGLDRGEMKHCKFLGDAADDDYSEDDDSVDDVPDDEVVAYVNAMHMAHVTAQDIPGFDVETSSGEEEEVEE